MNHSQKQKTGILLPAFVISLSLCIALLAFTFYQYQLLLPITTINGRYQSAHHGYRVNRYDAQFYGREYYIERVLEGQVTRLTEGSFEQVGDNVFLLTDSGDGGQLLVTTDHNGFHYHDPELGQTAYLSLGFPLAAPPEP